jgi:hypothetical protein
LFTVAVVSIELSGRPVEGLGSSVAPMYRDTYLSPPGDSYLSPLTDSWLRLATIIFPQ